MWAGSNFDYNGINCTFTEVLDLKMKLEDRIDIAISWFMDKKTPANLVMVYIEEPDEHGHAFGPNSKQVTQINQIITVNCFPKIVQPCDDTCFVL